MGKFEAILRIVGRKYHFIIKLRESKALLAVFLLFLLFLPKANDETRGPKGQSESKVAGIVVSQYDLHMNPRNT